jgi:hypothetical protein
MREIVNWMGNEDATEAIRSQGIQALESITREKGGKAAGWESLPSHNFPTSGALEDRSDDAQEGNPDLWLYRRRSVGILRRYLRFSVETGRLPSLLGREFFRAKVTSYKATTFEDRVIFVRDVEKSMGRLAEFDRQLLGRIFLQEHSHDQAACLLHCSRSTLERRLPEALDLLSEDFLRVGLLTGAPSRREFSE